MCGCGLFVVFIEMSKRFGVSGNHNRTMFLSFSRGAPQSPRHTPRQRACAPCTPGFAMTRAMKTCVFTLNTSRWRSLREKLQARQPLFVFICLILAASTLAQPVLSPSGLRLAIPLGALLLALAFRVLAVCPRAPLARSHARARGVTELPERVAQLVPPSNQCQHVVLERAQTNRN